MLPDRLYKTCPAKYPLLASVVPPFFHEIIAYLPDEVPNFTPKNKILHHSPGFLTITTCETKHAGSMD